MWSDVQFWRDSTWRSFRTFCQSLAGLLTVNHVSSAFNAPWVDLIGAAGIAALISLLQSIDRERAVGGATAEQPETEPEFETLTSGPGCGGDMR